MWIAMSTAPSLDSASCEANIVLDHKTTSAPHRAKPLQSREAKVKALCANNNPAYIISTVG